MSYFAPFPLKLSKLVPGLPGNQDSQITIVSRVGSVCRNAGWEAWAVGLGISALALMAFGFSRALCAVLRPLAGREPRHLVNAVLLCIGLVASAASAEPLSPDAQPTPLAKPVGAPVLGQAENATKPDRKSTRLNSSHTVISYAV